MANEEWAPYRQLYPDLVAGEDWRAPCHSFLVRSERATILVDTAVGQPGSWPDWTPEVEGRLPNELAALGVAATDVDAVFLTHLHIRPPRLEHGCGRRAALETVSGEVELGDGVIAFEAPGHYPGQWRCG